VNIGYKVLFNSYKNISAAEKTTSEGKTWAMIHRLEVSRYFFLLIFFK